MHVCWLQTNLWARWWESWSWLQGRTLRLRKQCSLPMQGACTSTLWSSPGLVCRKGRYCKIPLRKLLLTSAMSTNNSCFGLCTTWEMLCHHALMLLCWQSNSACIFLQEGDNHPLSAWHLDPCTPVRWICAQCRYLHKTSFVCSTSPSSAVRARHHTGTCTLVSTSCWKWIGYSFGTSTGAQEERQVWCCTTQQVSACQPAQLIKPGFWNMCCTTWLAKIDQQANKFSNQKDQLTVI